MKLLANAWMGMQESIYFFQELDSRREESVGAG